MVPRFARDDSCGGLVQGFGLQRDIGFAGGFFLGVFFHPGFPTFAGGGVASGKGEGSDVGVGDSDVLVGILWVEADYGVSQRLAGAAVEKITFDFAAIFAGDGYIAA